MGGRLPQAPNAHHSTDLSAPTISMALALWPRARSTTSAHPSVKALEMATSAGETYGSAEKVMGRSFHRMVFYKCYRTPFYESQRKFTYTRQVQPTFSFEVPWVAILDEDGILHGHVRFRTVDSTDAGHPYLRMAEQMTYVYDNPPAMLRIAFPNKPAGATRTSRSSSEHA